MASAGEGKALAVRLVGRAGSLPASGAFFEKRGRSPSYRDIVPLVRGEVRAPTAVDLSGWKREMHISELTKRALQSRPTH